MRWIIGIFIAMGCSTQAFAHPGHGVTPGDAPAHYLIEPRHALGAVLVGLAALAWRVWRRTSRGRGRR